MTLDRSGPRAIFPENSHRSPTLDAATTKPRDPANPYHHAADIDHLIADVRRVGPTAAAEILSRQDPAVVQAVLQSVSPGIAGDIIAEMDAEDRRLLYSTGPAHLTQQWSVNQ